MASPTIAARPDKRLSSAVVFSLTHGSANWQCTWWDRSMLGSPPDAMRCLSFLLVTAAPLHALAQDERPVPHPCPSPLSKKRHAITRVLFPKWQIQQPATAQDANHLVPHWGHRLIKNA